MSKGVFGKIVSAAIVCVFFIVLSIAVSAIGCGGEDAVRNDPPPYEPSAPEVTEEGDEEGSLHRADGYRYYVHWLKSGDNYIYGRINVPNDFDKDKYYPTIVMAHGFTATYRVYDPYVMTLTSLGYVCYTFDFAGGSYDSKSDGDFMDMTVMTEVGDLIAVVDDIKRQDYFNVGELYLMGESQGGLVASIAAFDIDDLAGLILLYPGFSVVEDINEKYNTPSDVPEHNEFLGVEVGREYVTDLIDLDIYEELTKYEGDVIIYHGDRDGIIPLSSSVKAEEAYPNAELVVIGNGYHGFRPAHAYEISLMIDEWIGGRTNTELSGGTNNHEKADI